jgi:hypothetical protein
MIDLKTLSNKNEVEMRTIAAEACCIPKQTNNNEGRTADLQIKQRPMDQSTGIFPERQIPPGHFPCRS